MLNGKTQQESWLDLFNFFKLQLWLPNIIFLTILFPLLSLSSLAPTQSPLQEGGYSLLVIFPCQHTHMHKYTYTQTFPWIFPFSCIQIFSFFSPAFSNYLHHHSWYDWRKGCYCCSFEAFDSFTFYYICGLFMHVHAPCCHVRLFVTSWL